MEKTIKIKPTGIVRRVDDLGRVVIPKEIRHNLRIREGDPLEIIPTSEGVYITPYKEAFIEDHKQRCLVLSKEELEEEIRDIFGPDAPVQNIEFNEKNFSCPVRVFCKTGFPKSPVTEVQQSLLYGELSRRFHYGRVNIVAIRDNAVIITFLEG